jgi:hypothetical protein
MTIDIDTPIDFKKDGLSTLIDRIGAEGFKLTTFPTSKRCQWLAAKQLKHRGYIKATGSSPEKAVFSLIKIYREVK